MNTTAELRALIITADPSSYHFRRFASVLAATTLLFSATACAQGPMSALEQQTSENTKERDVGPPKADIVQLLKDLKLRPFLGKDKALCHAFLEDFSHQNNIKYIEPIVRTDNYDDPRLKPYIEKCPKLELNKHMTFEARGFEEVMKLPRDERADYAASISYGTRNFKIYRVDINNNPTDGEEYVYYDEARLFVEPASLEGRIPVPEAGKYRVVDFARCDIEGGVNAGDVFRHKSQPVNIHGIIQYRGKHYIYSFEATDSGAALVALDGYVRTPSGKQSMSSICSYHN